MATRPRSTRNITCLTSRGILSLASMSAAPGFQRGTGRGHEALRADLCQYVVCRMGAALYQFPRRSAASALCKPAYVRRKMVCRRADGCGLFRCLRQGRSRRSLMDHRSGRQYLRDHGPWRSLRHGRDRPRLRTGQQTNPSALRTGVAQGRLFFREIAPQTRASCKMQPNSNPEEQGRQQVFKGMDAFL